MGETDRNSLAVSSSWGRSNESFRCWKNVYAKQFVYYFSFLSNNKFLYREKGSDSFHFNISENP